MRIVNSVHHIFLAHNRNATTDLVSTQITPVGVGAPSDSTHGVAQMHSISRSKAPAVNAFLKQTCVVEIDATNTQKPKENTLK